MGAEALLAALLTGLAVLSLPRRRVRLNLASASRLGRIQYSILLGGSILLAGLLWVDIVIRIGGRSNGQFLIVTILAGCFWALVLAATALPSLGRTTRSAAPSGWMWGASAYRGGVRAAPIILVALSLVTIAVAASLLRAHGILDSRVFLVFVVLALATIVLAFTVWLFGWPAVFVPRSLRDANGESRRIEDG